MSKIQTAALVVFIFAVSVWASHSDFMEGIEQTFRRKCPKGVIELRGNAIICSTNGTDREIGNLK